MLFRSGVAALLNCSFFIPLKRLVAVTSTDEAPEAQKQLESGYGELSLLARNYYSLIVRLNDTREALARCRSGNKEKHGDEG